MISKQTRNALPRNALRIISLLGIFLLTIRGQTTTATDTTAATAATTLFNWINVSETACAGVNIDDLIQMTQADRDAKYLGSTSFFFPENISLAFGFMLNLTFGKFDFS